MKLSELYRAIIEIGIDNDPRGKKAVREQLKDAKREAKDLKPKDKEYFDNDTLFNPYSDTRLLNVVADKDVKVILAGIDLETPEILLADRLRERGQRIDLLLSHHPEGIALAGLPDVMRMQAEIWEMRGVPINVGDIIIDKRANEIWKNLNPVNCNRPVDAARMLNFSYTTCHTPADNCVNVFLQKLVDRTKPRTMNDIVEMLLDIPEYRAAKKLKQGPNVLIGDGRKRAGNIHVDMTGGTEGPEDMIEKLAAAGVGTLIGMHMSQGLRKKATEHKMNVVIAGHIASDTLGLNLLFDELHKRSAVNVIGIAGFTRYARNDRLKKTKSSSGETIKTSGVAKRKTGRLR